MFDRMINNNLLNQLSTRALDVQPELLKSVSVTLLLLFSFILFGIEHAIKKLNLRFRSTNDSLAEAQIKTAS